MRVRMLEKILLMLTSVQSSLEYLASPSHEIIRSLSDNPELAELKFIEACRRNMDGGADFRAAWSSALCDRTLTPYLKPEDTAVLISFGTLFGVTDTAGQTANCQLHASMIKDKLSEAKRMCGSYASLAWGMGILCGIGAVIILI